MIAAGGTGGHIFPAIAVAEALRAREPHVEVSFVCGEKSVDREAYASAGISPIIMEGAPFAGGLMEKIKSLFGAAKSVKAARRMLKERNPQVVVGMGGYISGPLVLAATMAKVPTLLVEQNALPGRTNVRLAPRVSAIAVGYESAKDKLRSGRKVVFTGNPVRRNLFKLDRAAAAKYFDLSPDLLTLLVFGGSQGAKFLNDLTIEVLPILDASWAASKHFQVIWITGSAHFEEMQRFLKELKFTNLDKVVLKPFEPQMAHAYALATIAVSRAGAATCSELAICGIPSFLVPYPHAVDDHQTLNARTLEAAGAAIVIQEPSCNAPRLSGDLADLFAAEDKLRAMSTAARTQAPARAAESIAKIILEGATA